MQLLIKSLGRFFLQYITTLLKIDGGWRIGGLEGLERLEGLEGLEGEGWREGGLKSWLDSWRAG